MFSQKLKNSSELWQITKYGYLVCRGCVIRSGVFKYVINGKDKNLYLSDKEIEKSLFTLKTVKLTYGHQYASIENHKDVCCGNIIADSIKKNFKDGYLYVYADLEITDKYIVEKMIDLLEKNYNIELSTGYQADVIWENGMLNNQFYDGMQENLTHNHLAILFDGKKANMGQDIKIINNTNNSGIFLNQKVEINKYEVGELMSDKELDVKNKDTDVKNKDTDVKNKDTDVKNKDADINNENTYKNSDEKEKSLSNNDESNNNLDLYKELTEFIKTMKLSLDKVNANNKYLEEQNKILKQQQESKEMNFENEKELIKDNLLIYNSLGISTENIDSNPKIDFIKKIKKLKEIDFFNEKDLRNMDQVDILYKTAKSFVKKDIEKNNQIKYNSHSYNFHNEKINNEYEELCKKFYNYAKVQNRIITV